MRHLYPIFFVRHWRTNCQIHLRYRLIDTSGDDDSQIYRVQYYSNVWCVLRYSALISAGLDHSA
ncbi:MAG: hypothetical protein CLLPBCKN_007176 [Chroococcidiopsis cubana SAG 39.79]|nr:hypothetical protein [Chroococcidiopsis cubana SAG 39.79]